MSIAMDHHDRVEGVKEHLVETEVDALITTGASNSHYFSGFHTVADANYPIVLIPAEGEAQLFISRLDKDAATYASTIGVVVPENGFSEEIINHLPDNAEVLIDGQMTIGFYNRLQEDLSMIVDDSLVSGLRSIKDTGEQEHIREACRVAEKTLDKTITRLGEDAIETLTETMVAASIEYKLRKHGSKGAAFPSIVATNASSSLPHHTPTETEISDGPLLFDIGAVINGYCSDMSRTIHLGEPSATFREIYGLVLEAHKHAADALTPGTTAKEVDAAARNFLEKKGYLDQFNHSVGHGVGLDVHETPNLTPRSDQVLEEGMVVTIEPGLYLKGEFGVRIEDVYLLTENGSERLTESSRELTVIDTPD